MELAILSDIHGNLVALDTVIAELAHRSIDQIICLGDVAASGPQPHEVIDSLMGSGWPIVRGNADAWLLHPERYTGEDPFYQRIDEIDAWCESQLTGQDKAFLATFKPVIEVGLGDGLHLLGYHGSPRSDQEFVTATTPDQIIHEIFGEFPQHIFVGGHTHQQMLRRYRDAVLLNPGSVGLPYETMRPDARERNVPWAEYALLGWETGKLAIELCRVPLNVSVVKQAAFDCEMPHADWWASEWLE